MGYSSDFSSIRDHFTRSQWTFVYLMPAMLYIWHQFAFLRHSNDLPLLPIRFGIFVASTPFGCAQTVITNKLFMMDLSQASFLCFFSPFFCGPFSLPIICITKNLLPCANNNKNHPKHRNYRTITKIERTENDACNITVKRTFTPF